MEMYTVSQWVMFFYIYCFLGWVWESSYVSVKEKKWVNRGFLKGPFLPIYGSGALCVLIVTIPVRGHIVWMALVGMVSATLLEYVTGAAMERMFRVRYWDYTGKFMNINGHICLGSTLCWGVMTILIVEVVHRYIEALVFAVNEAYVTLAVLAITPVITADFVTSFHAAIHLRDILIRNERIQQELEKLSSKRQELEQFLQEMGERAMESAAGMKAQVMESAADMKDRAMESAAGMKAQVMESAAGMKDRAVESAADMKDRAVESAAGMKAQVMESAAGMKDRAMESAAQMRDAAAEQAAAARDQAVKELKELLLRMGELKGGLSIPYAKSIRGLLKRNPAAVSHHHTESFAQLKRTLAEKLEGMRR